MMRALEDAVGAEDVGGWPGRSMTDARQHLACVHTFGIFICCIVCGGLAATAPYCIHIKLSYKILLLSMYLLRAWVRSCDIILHIIALCAAQRTSLVLLR